mmetsp:Transcript_99818/g.237908  ORF Transcript_99818/g.237908 Transcript_99818/m.237908 type:complete len:85 (+) Transcript_99818:59-313(+)|eukprot:CAMPEP_0181451058 /NCGR_PEP_ID=MMETSP1110-20121109/28494_1 /TAXON_ID=174948 /ORGANISM="Symbiodinium sp., Strain CCMP421" /LENGTH=84 /DNA_ID=CAMNT_0023575295 /DNA_START=53 /DNA_END=307 /DNA_ORIENTATION=-
MPIPSAAELSAKAAMLNSVEPMDQTGEPDLAMMQAIARVCLALNCDAQRVAQELHLCLRRIQAWPPRDMEDFARKVLTGLYSAD